MASKAAPLGTGRTGGRDATTGVIPGRYALSVGNPETETPNGWKWTPLSEVAQLESGHTPSRKRSEYWDGNIPWIGIKDATENHGRKIYDTYQHVTPLGLDNSSARLLPANTVCLSRTASVGFVVVMGRPMATSQDFVNWVCGPNLDPYFLKYVLLSEREALLRFASGTTHQTIYYPEAKAFHACLPPIAEQKAIASLLGALDDKIELNRQMNATLEAMSRALFQSWFADFVPTCAKASELIAEGVLEIGDGYRAKNSELGPEGLPFVRAGDLDAGFDLDGAEKLCPESVAKAPTKISQPGDIAFTSKGTVGRIARVAFDSPRFVYAPQVCYWRTKSVENVHPAILYSWMAFGDFNAQVLSYAGQTDMAPYISLRDQREIMVPRFPDSQREIGDQIEALLTMKATNMKQSRTLGALRDTLLPKMLSGKLRPGI